MEAILIDSIPYEKEITSVPFQEKIITLKNLTPVFSPEKRDERKREIENRLFQIFIKYQS